MYNYEPLPRNDAIKALLKLDKRDLLNSIKDTINHVLCNICDAWRDEHDLSIDTFSLSRSFSLHHPR